MPTIEALTERAEPLTHQATGRDVFERFQREPDTMVIAVVEDGRPIGLIERHAFLTKMSGPFSHAVYADRSVTHLMDAEPAVVEAGVRIDAFCDVMLSGGPSQLMRGFIVTRAGVFQGVGTAASLLRAVNDQQRQRNAELVAEARALSDSRSRAKDEARSRSQFLSILGQELRTPMNGVLAVAELLRRQPLNDAAQAHVQTIVESSERLIRTLQDAIDLSRAEAGELDLSLATTPLRPLMDEVEETWRARALQDGVTLMVGYEGDTDLAGEIDGPRLRQIFNNLIENALTSSRNGVVEARLKAWVSGEDLFIEARVRDDGLGLPPGTAETLFAAGETAGVGGPGISLSICGRIIQRMGGRIWAEDNAGRGATVAFDLTARRSASQVDPATNVQALADLELQSNPHILIVDDNLTNRVVAQALCEMFGCTSETAEDGLEALEAVRERPFDLVLMDIKMPRMDGVQATKAIRALAGPAGDIPIVALTANADPDDARGYLAIGMAAVVEKPIKPERLRMAMNLALTPQATETVVTAGHIRAA